MLGFKHGARAAAARIASYGVRSVVALKADMLDERGVQTFLAALRPALDGQDPAGEAAYNTDLFVCFFFFWGGGRG